MTTSVTVHYLPVVMNENSHRRKTQGSLYNMSLNVVCVVIFYIKLIGHI